MDQPAAKNLSNARVAAREARRQQLIDATIDSISKRRFSGTTLATVTASLKLSHGTVTYHFDSKESLYVETLGYLAEEHHAHWHAAVLDAAPDPAKQLAAIVGTDFDPKIASPKKLAVWFAFWGQAKYRPHYLKSHNKYDAERFDEITRLCTEIVEDGAYSHLDPNVVARCVEGLWLNLLLYPHGTHRAEARDDCLFYLAEVFPKHFSPPLRLSL